MPRMKVGAEWILYNYLGLVAIPYHQKEVSGTRRSWDPLCIVQWQGMI